MSDLVNRQPLDDPCEIPQPVRFLRCRRRRLSLLSIHLTNTMTLPRTLISPLSVKEHAQLPAIILPASSNLNSTLSYTKLESLVNSIRDALDKWSGRSGTRPLAVGDVVSMSLVNSTEFAAAFLGITAHR